MTAQLAGGRSGPRFQPADRRGRASIASALSRGARSSFISTLRTTPTTCTAEAIAFNGLRAAIRPGANTRSSAYLPIPSPATTSSNASTSSTLTLASDEPKAAIEAYGVWREKSMFGRKYMGVERTTVLIDRAGRDRAHLAQGQDPRPCRGSAGGGPRALPATGTQPGAAARLVCERLTLMSCNRRHRPPRRRGPELCSMAVRDAYPKPKLPTSHYFFSLARGDNMRTFAAAAGPALVRPFARRRSWRLWSLGASLFIVFHDDMLGAIVAREAEMQYAYEDRLAEAHAQLDRVTSRQLLDQNSFEGKVHELLSRQAQLEQRTSIVASMAGQAGLGGETTAALAERARLKQAGASPKGAGDGADGDRRRARPARRRQRPRFGEGLRADRCRTISAQPAPAKPRPLEEPRARAHQRASGGRPRPTRASPI